MKHLALLILTVFLGACAQPAVVTVILPDGFKVAARVADTPEKQEKGLMFVTELPENEGMLFVFDKEEEQIFWMKNTLIDLDMVFIGADRQVTTVAEQMQHTYTYTPDDEIPYAAGYGQYVLELAAKTAARHGVKPEAQLQFIWTNTK
ncbi:MAG: DUF192 domain-containing protein [Elusimicrobiaceae bacterium]|nr:DUF192 domain-containing protein [Elusimicrobiaceae bacterium]